jgi:hypothetical protein
MVIPPHSPLSSPGAWWFSQDVSVDAGFLCMNCCVEGHDEWNILYALILRIKDLSVVICSMVE